MTFDFNDKDIKVKEEVNSVLNTQHEILNEKEIIANNDPILSKFTDLLELQRSQNSNTAELEIRVGIFNEENMFTPGYNNMTLVSKLLPRLKNNGSQKSNWTTIPELQFMDVFYGDVRKRLNESKPPVLSIKKKIGQIDIGSDRFFGFRISLADEKIPTKDDLIKLCPNKSLKTMEECLKELSSEPPTLVRYVQRASFTERIDFKNGFFVNLQFDVSKVASGKDKLDCTRRQASYHCEIELIDKLFRLGNVEEERNQSKMIAYVMLAQAKALLGTYRKVGDIYEPLPQPILHFINQN